MGAEMAITDCGAGDSDGEQSLRRNIEDRRHGGETGVAPLVRPVGIAP